MKQKVLLTVATALTSFVMISLGAIASLQMQHTEAPTLLKTSLPIPQTQDDSLSSPTYSIPPFAPSAPSTPAIAFTSDISSHPELSDSQKNPYGAPVVTDSAQIASEGVDAVDTATAVVLHAIRPAMVRATRSIRLPTTRTRVIIVRPEVTLNPVATALPIPSPRPVVLPGPIVTREPDHTDLSQHNGDHTRSTQTPRTHDTNPFPQGTPDNIPVDH